MNANHEPKTETLPEIIARLGITATATNVPENPNAQSGDWSKSAHHWHVKLNRYTVGENRDLLTYYSQGAAHVEKRPYLFGMGPRDLYNSLPKPGARNLSIMQAEMMPKVWQPTKPTVEDVLSCLCMDSSGYDSARDFEGWAEDYGYSPDSRNAEKTWRIVGEQSRELRQFLGSDYDAVLIAAQEF